MGFVSILKKIGNVILLAEGFEKAYGPVVTGMIPGTKDDAVLAKVNDRLDQATKIVIDAEVMGQAISAPGTQKAKMAGGPMFQLLMDLPILQGKKPKDPVKAKADAQALSGALAEFLNNFEG